jgi:hypothetical protein
MELINKHIFTLLLLIVNKKSSNLENNFNEVQNDLKIEFIRIIRYLDYLLAKTFSTRKDNLSALHIHIDYEFTDKQKLLIAEFLLIKTFRNCHSSDLQSNQTNSLLIKSIKEFRDKKDFLKFQCPEGASSKNGGNKIFKKWIKDQNEFSSLLNFYESINKNALIKPKSIFNTQINIYEVVSKLFQYKPFCVDLNSKYQSYNIFNTTRTLHEIDQINNEIVDNLDSIILFDCDRKSIMSNFSFEEIIKWNTEYQTNFKKYLIITFGKNFQSINQLGNKIGLIREKFKIPFNSTYTLLSSEIDGLLKRKSKKTIQPYFIGFETSIFWNTFQLETGIRELYELKSIKLMNIYSTCLNEEIKEYIIGDIFSKNETSDFISSNTKMSILELSDESINILKDNLSNTLDLIIHSDLKLKIIEKLKSYATIIFDEVIIKNRKLISMITDCIGIGKYIKLNSWSDLLNSNSTYLIILSYRDQGKYPNYYYPNLLEYNYSSDTIVNALLPRIFFGNLYKWSNYYLLKEYHKYLTHPIRENYFEWNRLKELIQETKPNLKLNIDWELEYEYSNSENRETYKIKLKNQRAKIFHSSDFLIFCEKGIKKPRIERVKWFFENEDLQGSKYNIQKLDELLNEFNPAERLIDTSQQELDLEIIRNQLGLGNITAGNIWKKLLRRKAELLGLESLYEDLKLIFDKNNIPLVSINHFRNSWLNTESDILMPRGNKVFKYLCDYLELNNNYRLILYRLKNASISGKIEATKKYSNLLRDLFTDGCFDSNASIKTLLQSRITYYRNNHALDELGIDNVNPLNGLTALIELIQQEVILIELETIEKLINE